ncbi:MAG: hypothetical protein QM582_15710 [Micropruina sp.]|uniref:hypothetical protein n=1 Tax=Micropruina sp. TaxID=2737536 RepID=UPI0039E4043B
MYSEPAVTRALQAAPPLVCPDDIKAQLLATIAGEVELRRASRFEPDADVRELKAGSPLWSDHPVDDT